MSKRRTGSKPVSEDFEVHHPNAAGIDIGARELWVSVPPDRAERSVRRFGALGPDIAALCDWLLECGVDTVAMESTGVYWVPLYETLEERGVTVCLVNARHVRAVPGRKSDVLDCQWLRRLHTHGLVRASFRPAAPIVELRQYLRQRDHLVRSAGDHVRRMHHALTLMNVQLQNVISDLVGKTGLAILRAIVAGERDPKVLAQHRDFRCRASQQVVEASLVGNFQPEHVFALKHALRLYDLHQELIAECDRTAASHLDSLRPPDEPPPVPTPQKKRRPKEATVDYRSRFAHLLGVDLAAIPGLSDYSVAALISEIGTDMTRWPDSAHFASWLCLTPRTHITGGQIKNRRAMPTSSRAAQLLRMAALNAGRTQTAIGASFRNIARRKSKPEAVVATAHKLARTIYTLIRNPTPFVDLGPAGWDAAHKDRTLRNLRRRAKSLGFDVIPAASSSPQANC